MSRLCAQKLARLQTIVAERAVWADQLAQVKRLHNWLLNASRLIMRQTPVMEEGACQAQKGYRYDEAGHQGYG